MDSIIPTNLSPESGTVRNGGADHHDLKRHDSSVANTPISHEKILAALATDATSLGVCPTFKKIKPQFDLHLFESLSSTSTHLWEMLADDSSAGTKAGTVVVARQQSLGRGQRGRSWQSEPGGLYLSLALEPDWPVDLGAQLTCLSAWGIATAFNNLGIPVDVKWPNDLFFRGKKLGGILTETKLSHSKACADDSQNMTKPAPCIRQAVIGVGINWHNPVPQTGVTLAQILEEQPYQTAKNKINCLEVLIAVVLRGILQGYYFYQQVGSQVFMKAYQNLLTQVGNFVSISSDSLQPSGSVANNHSGKVVGISEEGYLEVELEEAELGQAPYQAIADAEQGKARNIFLIRPGEIHLR